jgi:hypothetical protein
VDASSVANCVQRSQRAHKARRGRSGGAPAAEPQASCIAGGAQAAPPHRRRTGAPSCSAARAAAALQRVGAALKAGRRTGEKKRRQVSTQDGAALPGLVVASRGARRTRAGAASAVRGVRRRGARAGRSQAQPACAALAQRRSHGEARRDLHIRVGVAHLRRKLVGACLHAPQSSAPRGCRGFFGRAPAHRPLRAPRPPREGAPRTTSAPAAAIRAAARCAVAAEARGLSRSNRLGWAYQRRSASAWLCAPAPRQCGVASGEAALRAAAASLGAPLRLPGAELTRNCRHPRFAPPLGAARQALSAGGGLLLGAAGQLRGHHHGAACASRRCACYARSRRAELAPPLVPLLTPRRPPRSWTRTPTPWASRRRRSCRSSTHTRPRS